MRTAERPRPALAAAVAAYLLFVAYQSLAGGGPTGCAPALIQQGRGIMWSDGLANLVAYLPLGLLAAAWLGPRRTSVAIVGAFLAIAGFSLAMELLQACMAARVSSWYDWATNSAGGLLGLLAMPRGRRWHRAAVSRPGFAHGRPGARTPVLHSPLLWPVLLFAGAWLAMLLAPWRFTLDVGTLRANLAFLRHLVDWPGPDPWVFARYLFGWLALGVGLRALWPERGRASLALSCLLALALVGQLLLVRRALSVDELVAMAVGAGLAASLPNRSSGAVLARLLPALAVLSVTAYQLAPRSRGALASGFEWLPQLGRSGPLAALELALMYSWLAFALVLSLRWSLSRGVDLGRRRWVLPAAVVGIMLATEIVQLWSRGRVPDTSAPLVTALAYVVAWALVGPSGGSPLRRSARGATPAAVATEEGSAAAAGRFDQSPS